MTRSLWIHRTRSLAAAALILGGAAGCSDDDPVGVIREFGTYSLVRMNNQPLPYTITTSEGTMIVQGASLALAQTSTGTLTYSATVNGTRDGVQGVLLSDAGTYTVSGSSLTFASSTVAGLVYPGARSGNTVTVSVPGVAVGASGTITLAFEKQ